MNAHQTAPATCLPTQPAREAMTELLSGLQPGYTLPQPFYNDPGFHALDMEYLWARTWLFAGHTCEVAKPGDFFTLQVGRDPVVVVRDREGRVRAFFNACRHRGSKICTADRGTAAKLVCPYHQWTFELDGRLLYARDMGQDFDAARWGLKPVHCETVGGYVFICLAEEAPDFEAFRANVEPYMAPHHLEQAKIAAETSIIENGNWKLVMENNRECYHCRGGHPELMRVYDDVPDFDPSGQPTFGANFQSLWSRLEAKGIPSRYAPHGHYRLLRMPLSNRATSMTVSGKPAVRRPLPGVTETDMGSMMLFHFPNTWNHMLADHAVSFRVLPIGPEQTLVTTKWLVHPEAVEGVDYDVADLTRVWESTNSQDRRQVEENQMGVNSRAYEPGPYSPVHENGVIHFVDWYTDLMRGQLGPQSGASLREVAA